MPNDSGKFNTKIRSKLVKKDERGDPVEVVEREYEKTKDGEQPRLLDEKRYVGEEAKKRVEESNEEEGY